MEHSEYLRGVVKQQWPKFTCERRKNGWLGAICNSARNYPGSVQREKLEKAKPASLWLAGFVDERPVDFPTCVRKAHNTAPVTREIRNRAKFDIRHEDSGV